MLDSCVKVAMGQLNLSSMDDSLASMFKRDFDYLWIGSIMY